MVQQVVRSSTAVPTTLQQWSAKILASQAPIPPPLPPGPTPLPPPPPLGPWKLILLIGIAILLAILYLYKDSMPPPFGLLNRQRAYTWPSGDTYTGEWKDAKRNGLGIHKFADGTVLAGTWKNDKLAP